MPGGGRKTAARSLLWNCASCFSKPNSISGWCV